MMHQVEIAGLNSDLQQEYARQREHLERNLATLKKKVVKEGELHRTDYVRIMQVMDAGCIPLPPETTHALGSPDIQGPTAFSWLLLSDLLELILAVSMAWGPPRSPPRHCHAHR